MVLLFTLQRCCSKVNTLIHPLDLCALIVMQKDVVVLIAFLSHDGGTYLTKSHTVAPACASEDKFLGQSIDLPLGIHHECRTEQVGVAQNTSDFQFLADGHGALRALYAQFGDSSTTTPFHGNERTDSPKVHIHLLAISCDNCSWVYSTRQR